MREPSAGARQKFSISRLSRRPQPGGCAPGVGTRGRRSRTTQRLADRRPDVAGIRAVTHVAVLSQFLAVVSLPVARARSVGRFRGGNLVADGRGSAGGVTGSPRVLVARSAMTAAASRKTA